MLEICATNIETCINAEKGGAKRVELCIDLKNGGVTPPIELVREVRKEITIDLFVLVRCRIGDFFFTKEEVDLMASQIENMREAGADGIVMGCLKRDYSMNVIQCKKLVDAAGSMKITFHRAFDKVRKPTQALEDIIELGCGRILTSGQQKTALEGAELISDLISQADGRIIIMPGAGINESTIREVMKQTGAKEFHASLKKKKTEMDLDLEIVDENTIRRVVNLIENER